MGMRVVVGRGGSLVESSGLDANSEVPERSRKNFEMISYFVTPERSIQSVLVDLTISTGTRVPAKYQVPESRSRQFRLVYTPGRVDSCRPEGRGFESRSCRHVGSLGKSFTHRCLWRFGVKLRHSIRAVSGASLSSS